MRKSKDRTDKEKLNQIKGKKNKNKKMTKSKPHNRSLKRKMMAKRDTKAPYR
jgi:hypothetical protein